MTGYLAKNPDHDEGPDWSPEWQAEQDREAIQRQFRAFTNDQMHGALNVAEAFSESLTIAECKEIADEMHHALDGGTVLPDFLEIGRIVHGALIRHARACAVAQRRIQV